MKTLTGTPKELSMQLFNLDQQKLYEIKEYHPLRGTQANRYFHKLVNEFARYNRSNGYAIGDDEMKIRMNLDYGTIATKEDGSVVGVAVPKGSDIKEFYPYAKFEYSKGNTDYYIFYKRTHELNSKEFCQLIKGVEQECRDVGIKTLSDIEFENMMEEYEKEYKK